MRGRVSILLFAVLLLAVLPAVSSEIIHEDWHKYYDFFTIDDDYYEVKFNHMQSTDTMVIQSLLKINDKQYILTAKAYKNDEDDFIVRSKDCVREGLIRYCIINVSLEPEKGGHADEYGYYHHGTLIGIYEEPPDAAYIEIEHDLPDGSDFFFGEEERVNLILTNVGNKTARIVRINETIGDGLQITRFNDFDYKIGNRLTAMVPEIRKEDSVTLTYYLEADDYINSSNLSTKISYSAPEFTTETASENLNIPYPYGAVTRLAKNTVKIEEKNKLTVTIQNKEQSPLTVALSVDVPRDVLTEGLVHLSKSSENLFGTLELEPDEEDSFEVDLSSYYTNDYNVSLVLQFGINNQFFKTEQNLNFAVSNDQVTPKLYPSKEKMRSGEPITVALYIKNEDNDVSFYDVDGWVGSDFFNDTYLIERLEPEISVPVMIKTYYPPSVNQPTTKTIRTAGTFTTVAGETEEFSTQKELLILPENQSLILYQDVNTTTLRRGQEVTIITSAENIADSGVDVVSVYDLFDEDIDVSFGKTDINMNIRGGEKNQMYVYKLQIPETYTKEMFTITSVLKSKSQEIMRISTEVEVTDPVDPSQLTIDPETNETVLINDSFMPETNATENETVDGGDDGEGVPVDWGTSQRNDNFLERIIKGIADFFTSFF